MRFDPMHPEFADVESFVQFLMDEDRTTFFPGEAQAVAIRLKKDQKDITEKLISFGFQPTTAPNRTPGRGILSNPNGTHPFQGTTFATSGSDNILGFAGRS
jgi:hypothetical protein